MTEDIYTQQIPELDAFLDGVGRLGRHVGHDPRSKRYAYNTTGAAITTVRHLRHVPVFDQGDLGSCTGNAAVGCLATEPTYFSLPEGTVLDEALAVNIYSYATTLDDDPDNYPPVDTGSTGLAAAKSLQHGGYISAYQHTFTLDDALKALVDQPVMLGMNWYSSFDEPGIGGLVKITKHADVRGGHEVYLDEIAPGNLVGFTNSWTDQWGAGGRAYMSFAALERLLHEDGDITVPLPGIAPTPVPAPTPAPTPSPTPSPVTPAPTPSPEDVELWVDMQKWAKSKGLT